MLRRNILGLYSCSNISNASKRQFFLVIMKETLSQLYEFTATEKPQVCEHVDGALHLLKSCAQNVTQ